MAAFLSLDVDANGVTHAAFTNGFNPWYSHITSGTTVTEEVDANLRCSENTPSVSSNTRPIVMADGSAKAAVICTSSAGVIEFTWNGTAWTSSNISTGSGSGAGVFELTRTGNHLAWRYTDGTNNFLQFAELAGGAWTVKQINNQYPSLVDVLGGATGAAQVGWVSTSMPSNLQVVTQTATGFSAAKSVPHVADVYALDADGTLIGVKKDLTFHAYKNGAWTSVSIGGASAAATAIALVVDANSGAHVAWINSAGVYLATRVGSIWLTEMVSTMAAADVALAAGPTGKVAIGIRSTASSELVVFN
jgi:hypothetical protein